MAKIYPFHGRCYETKKAGDISKLVTQPYDKISESMRQNYARQSPFNVVHVIKNENYQEAAGYLNRWFDEGILVRDEEPTLYPYQQVFEFDGEKLSRTGFIGLISLEDQDLAVKGHENVLRAPLEDRLNLIRANEANEGLIFTLFSDTRMQVDKALDKYISNRPPLFDVTDEYGAVHRLWKCPEEGTNSEIMQVLKDASLYIADGHHRFQTAVLYHQECLQKGWKPAAVESFDKRMIAAFNMEASGLKILPTHRAIRGLEDFDSLDFLNNLNSHFEVARASTTSELQEDLKSGGHRIGVATASGQFYCLKPRSETLEDSSFMPHIKGPARRLDVNLLHEGILRPYLGIGAEELASQRYVDYYRESSELLSKLQEGHYQCAFLLNPTTMEQVREISELGEKMPQKSTDFFPKLLTGLVFMKMEIEKGR